MRPLFLLFHYTVKLVESIRKFTLWRSFWTQVAVYSTIFDEYVTLQSEQLHCQICNWRRFQIWHFCDRSLARAKNNFIDLERDAIGRRPDRIFDIWYLFHARFLRALIFGEFFHQKNSEQNNKKPWYFFLFWGSVVAPKHHFHHHPRLQYFSSAYWLLFNLLF